MRPGIYLPKATAKLLIALLLLSCVSRAHPWRGHAHKHHSPKTHSLLGASASYALDTDLKANRVTLSSSGFDKTISIKFGSFPNQELSFTTRSPEGGNLVAGDIDRDGDVDLIWVGGADRNDAVVWLNQGEGNFAEADDRASFASELDELFLGGDPLGKRSVKKHRKNFSLVSSSFTDVGPNSVIWSHGHALQQHYVVADERVAARLTLLSHLPTRGPPSIPS